MFRKLLYAMLVAAMMLCSIISAPSVLADYVEGEKSGTGTAVVGNVSPSILSMGIYLSGSNLSAVDPWTQYEFRVTAKDNNKIQDIKNITITLVSLTGTEGSFDKTASYGFQYDNSTGTETWRELTAFGWSASYTYLNTTASSWPTGSVEGTWVFALKLYKTAHRESTWTMKGFVKDNAGLSATKANGFSVNWYISFTIPSSVSWPTLSPGAVNATAESMPASVTVTANDVVSIQIKGSGDLTNGNGGTIPLNKVYVGQSISPLNNDGKKLSQTYQNLYTPIASPDNSNYETYWFISVPDPTPSGTYTFTYYIRVQ